MLGFKLLLQGGRGVLAVSFLGLEALNLGSEISGLTELKPAPAGRCLNAHLSFAFSGSCLDSSLKGGPGITSKMELGHCKEFWEDERLEGSQVRPGSSPCLPPGVFAKPLTSGALLPVHRRLAQKHTLHLTLDCRPRENGDFD